MGNQDGFDREFATLRELGDNVFVLRGATIIVELQPEQELKTKGGLIIATKSDQVIGGVNANKLEVGKVLMTGPGYWQEDGKYEALEVKAGAMVILPQYSTQYISMFPGIQRPTGGKLGMVKMENVLAYYPSQEAFQEAQAKLN